ncbi:MAG TPA: 2-oxoglutarate dehydrogenase E1 component, partial [Chitinophagales bacterium]|nr:2-oxoglutarate dehydrogenase E1 component [Chitinophagales bacterium]
KVKRVLLCSGKVYYDLLERKESTDRKDIAIVRVEQIYPLAKKQYQAILDKYKNAEFVWVQEEPKNMGAWTFVLSNYPNGKDLKLISRAQSASTATGFSKIHAQEQKAIVDEAFA